MIKSELPLNLGSGTKMVRFTITFADLAAGTTTADLVLTLQDVLGTLFSVPQGSLVLGVRAKSDTAFTGGSATALTITNVGKNGTNNAFISASTYDIFAAPTDTNVLESAALFKAGQDSSFNLTVTFHGDGTRVLNAYTAGVMHIDVFLLQLGPINTQAFPPTVNPAY